MKKFVIEFPEDWGFHAVGCLSFCEDPLNLNQDMYEIELPNGVLVSSGWYPEGDPQGKYLTVAYQGLEILESRTSRRIVNALIDIYELIESHRNAILSEDTRLLHFSR